MFEAFNSPGKAYVEIDKAAIQLTKMERTESGLKMLRLKREAFEKSYELLSMYRWFLSDDLRVSASKLTWLADGPNEYKELFLSNVLNMAYRPFDESHKNYYKILRVIQEFNPEWEKAFVRRHDDWVKMLKARKIPIYIGTQ